MKSRSGFVSNSSTSSFIIIGIKLKDELTTKNILDIMNRANFKSKVKQGITYFEDDLKEELYHNFPAQTGLRLLDGPEDGVEGIIIGYVVEDSGCDSILDSGSISIKDIKEKESKLKYMFNSDEDVKVYYGSRCA